MNHTETFSDIHPIDREVVELTARREEQSAIEIAEAVERGEIELALFTGSRTEGQAIAHVTESDGTALYFVASNTELSPGEQRLLPFRIPTNTRVRRAENATLVAVQADEELADRAGLLLELANEADTFDEARASAEVDPAVFKVTPHLTRRGPTAKRAGADEWMFTRSYHDSLTGRRRTDTYVVDERFANLMRSGQECFMRLSSRESTHKPHKSGYRYLIEPVVPLVTELPLGAQALDAARRHSAARQSRLAA